jgi:hypothetical protein
LIIYTTDKALRKKIKKKKKTKELIKAEEDYATFLKAVGYTGKKTKRKIPAVDLPAPPTNYAKTSDTIPAGVCAKTSIDDWKWKKTLPEENAKTADAIDRKKKQVGIAYNKGSYQFLTEGTDTTTLGKK